MASLSLVSTAARLKNTIVCSESRCNELMGSLTKERASSKTYEIASISCKQKPSGAGFQC